MAFTSDKTLAGSFGLVSSIMGDEGSQKIAGSGRGAAVPRVLNGVSRGSPQTFYFVGGGALGEAAGGQLVVEGEVPGVDAAPGLEDVDPELGLLVEPEVVPEVPGVPGMFPHGEPAGFTVPGAGFGLTVEGVVVVPGVGFVVEFDPGTEFGVVLAGGVAVCAGGVAVLPGGVAVPGAGVAVPGAGGNRTWRRTLSRGRTAGGSRLPPAGAL